jgi:hypothetical protein
MIYLFLIIMVLGISFLMVRVGGLALELTGMGAKQANFQSLSCFTGTGFTTRESEMVVKHPARRRIASVLMVAGNIVFVTMIGSFVNTLATSRDMQEHVSLSFISQEIRVHYSLVMIGELLLVVFSFWALYVFFTRSPLWRYLQKRIKARMSEMDAFSQVSFEEFMIGTHGCGTIRMKVDAASPFCGRTLGEINMRAEYHAQVLAFERGQNVIYNPSATDKVERGDFLILFGKISDMASKLNLKD